MTDLIARAGLRGASKTLVCGILTQVNRIVEEMPSVSDLPGDKETAVVPVTAGADWFSVRSYLNMLRFDIEP